MRVPSSDHYEPQKVIITQSIPAALRCCIIHIIPLTVSSTIITLNMRGTYLGADLMSPVRSETINLMLFQLAAKGHEIMVVASLATIVLQYVRHELLFGDGLPLGLLGSGLTFNNLEFFFQKEFYGGLRYMAAHGNKPRKIAFIGIVMVAGLVATLTGPASAVLLVPKSQDWSAGGTRFFLNGTESHFWPDNLSGQMPELQRLCNQDNSTRLGVCPGGGYHSLWTHWGTMNRTTFQTQHVRPYAKDLSGSRFYWPVSSPSSLIPPLYALGDIQPGPNGRTSLVQPHAATAVLLQRLAEDWWGALRARKGLSSNQVDDRTASATFRNAMTVARCGTPQILRASDTTAHFPSIDGRFDFADSLPLDVDSLNSTQTDHLRFRWVHLPRRFGAASIGGLFETSWKVTEPSEASRVVIGCTVQAGWVPATVYTDKYTFWTGWYPWNILFGDRTPAWTPTSNNSSNGRVAFGDDWLDLLTPPAPIIASGTGSWRPSTIESIFLNAGLAANEESLNGTGVADDWLANGNSSWERVSLLEAIVCSVVLDGLSRTGSYRAFNTSGPISEWSIANYNPLPDFNSLVLKSEPAIQPLAINPGESTTIEAKMEISGFSMQSSLASFLAMSVLLVHMVMATVHIIYVILKRHTSGSWSTVGELIALSQNSQPAFETLANTGGGIQCSKTYAQVAKIRVRMTPSSSNQGHIELLFNEPSASESHQHNPPGRELDEMHNTLKASLSSGLTVTAESLVDVPLEARETTARVQPDCPYA
ncbi:hypothetical protein BDW59DRAFT_180515 [Aspergillus cavernicola]|uniref:Uncharacterized protein n=1 Tax=Aspergillus cavernicola TaxID=176166 RepID=A0ABR4J076_9EURO